MSAPEEAAVPQQPAEAEAGPVSAKEEEPKVEPKAEPNAEPKAEPKAAPKPEQKAEPKVEAPKEPEELETDAVPAKGKKITSVAMNGQDCTVDVIVGANGILSGLQSDVFSATSKGIRATHAVKSGRYFFEARIMEWGLPARAQGRRCRVGVSTPSASHHLGQPCCTDSVAFDCDGRVHVAGKPQISSFGLKKVRPTFDVGDNVAILINLQSNSANANTVSLFRNGLRVTAPIPLPESMVGKPLFPHVSYAMCTLAVNLGPSPRSKLPFTVPMINGATKADLVESTCKRQDKPKLVVPVGLPENGFFDWADNFKLENPDYVEVSSRALVDWLQASGSGPLRVTGGSIERPVVTGVDVQGLGLNDGSARKNLFDAAVRLGRNVVIADLTDNLQKQFRADVVQRSRTHESIAVVVVGEPADKIKERAREVIRAEKRRQHQMRQNAKKQAWSKRKQVKKQKKEAAKAKKQAEKARLERVAALKEQAAKRAEEMRKKAEAIKAKKQEQAGEGAEGATADVAEKKAEEAPEPAKESKPETPVAEEDPQSESEPEPADEPFEDDTDYSNVWYLKRPSVDATQDTITQNFSKFSAPDESEGFSELRYEWAPKEQAREKINAFVVEKQKFEKLNVTPSPWFHEQLKLWNTAMAEWRKAAAASQAANRGATEDDEDEPEIWGVEDVKDCGNGKPLFKCFQKEDWALLQLRFEFHLLIHAFERSVGKERPGIHPTVMHHYYNMFFKKPFTPAQYGQKSFADLVLLLADTVSVRDEDGCTEAGHPGETPLETFVKLTEEARRERIARIEAGDESARLKFSDVAMRQPSPAFTSLGKGASFGVGAAAAGRGKGLGKGVMFQRGHVQPMTAFAKRPAYPPTFAPMAKVLKGAGKGMH